MSSAYSAKTWSFGKKYSAMEQLLVRSTVLTYIPVVPTIHNNKNARSYMFTFSSVTSMMQLKKKLMAMLS